MHLPPPGTDLFHSTRLQFRRFTMKDLPNVFAYQSSSIVNAYLYHAPRSLDECQKLLLQDTLRTTFHKNGDKLRIAICHKTSVQLLGEVILIIENSQARQIEIGWVLHPNFWGQGYASEAAHACTEFAFHVLNAHRVFARIDDKNLASIRICEKLHFNCEAHLIENEINPHTQTWGNEVIYALLEQNYRQWQIELVREIRSGAQVSSAMSDLSNVPDHE